MKIGIQLGLGVQSAEKLEKTLFLSITRKRQIGWRRVFLYTIGVNELRIRPADTTHAAVIVFRDIQLNFIRPIMKKCFGELAKRKFYLKYLSLINIQM